MKTKNKMLALLEIAVVLCSLFLMGIPAITAEQNQEMHEMSASTITTASEDDFVLGVYGNANEDDTIDMRDLTYEKLIFFGKKPETGLADAKYDGKINPLDFIQIKLIIVGKEKEITIVDSADRIVTVKKPINRIIPLNSYSVESLRSLNAADKLVAVSGSVPDSPIYFGELCDLPDIGAVNNPDYEVILNLQPDLAITYTKEHSWSEEVQNKLESLGITTVSFEFNHMQSYVEEIKKLGYILGKKTEAEELINWYGGIFEDTIKARTEKLSDEAKPRVYYEYVYGSTYYTYGGGCLWQQKFDITGGRNIAVDLPGGSMKQVDPEWLIEQNPEIIVEGGSWDGGFLWGCYDTDDTTKVMAARDAVLNNRPELANSIAVKNGKVYMLGVTISDGCAYIIALAYMAKWFHPELFEDLDPQAIHQEYLTRFQRIDYDLDKHGVFVYPKEPVS